MNKITIQDYKDSWNINIDKFKVLYSKNQEEKYRIIRTLKHVIQKEEKSEYESTSSTPIDLIINEKKLDLKNLKMYMFTTESNFADDFKISSKSLISDYLETVLQNVEYTDEYQMLESSMKLFATELLSKFSIISKDNSLNFSMSTLSVKLIMKLIEIYLIKNDAYSLDFDFSLLEKLEFINELVKKISSIHIEQRILLIVLLDELDDKYYDLLSTHEIENLHILCFVNEVDCSINMNDLLIIGKSSIDFSDDEQLFEKLIIEQGLYNDLTELKIDISEKLRNKLETTKLINFLV